MMTRFSQEKSNRWLQELTILLHHFHVSVKKNITYLTIADSKSVNGSQQFSPT